MNQNTHQFPLGLCVATLVVTGLALSASLIGVQWGASPLRSDALMFAWKYVNVALCAAWFLVWPAAIYRGNTAAVRLGHPLLWQLGTMVVAAIPAMGVAGWLSMASSVVIAHTIAMHAGFAVFVFGALAFGGRSRTREVVVAGALASIYLALPALAYLQLEFLPAASSRWLCVIPALALTGYQSTFALTWGISLAYAAIGIILLALPAPKTTAGMA